MTILDLLALTALEHDQHDLPMGEAEWRAWKAGCLHRCDVHLWRRSA